MTVEEATRILAIWDGHYNKEGGSPPPPKEEDVDELREIREKLPEAVLLLNRVAAQEREEDPARGRCMLGICAPSGAPAGIAALKSFVTALQLPRGLLHGMDVDGVPVDLEGSGVYIKYNTGGVYTFADIRKSGVGFDALWKPGDALLEMYDGNYEGVYFQVELQDGEFRQFLVPLDLFG